MSGDECQLQLIAHQTKLEELFSKNQTIPRIKAEFIKEDVNEFLNQKGIPLEFGMDFLVQMALHKRASIQTLVNVLYRHFKNAQKTANMLLKCAEADLAEYDTQLKTFIVIYEISNDVQSDIDRFQYPLPMVVEPKPIEDNLTSGYLLHKGSVILRDNHHNDDVCLDHLTRLNAVRFTVNLDTAHMVHNRWKNLDKPKEGESHDEFMARKKAFLKYDRTAKDVMALLMQHSDQFYLTHRYDKRGRTYCQGYHVNYQGAAWNKAVVEFAEKELVE